MKQIKSIFVFLFCILLLTSLSCSSESSSERSASPTSASWNPPPPEQQIVINPTPNMESEAVVSSRATSMAGLTEHIEASQTAQAQTIDGLVPPPEPQMLNELTGATQPTVDATTATLSNNLSEGSTFTLGPAEVKVIKVSESMTTPIEKRPASAGMKFVLVQLKVIKVKDELTTERFIFETISGKKLDQLGSWMDNEFGKLETMGATTVSSVDKGGTPINVFFEIPKDEDISTIRLSYR